MKYLIFMLFLLVGCTNQTIQVQPSTSKIEDLTSLSSSCESHSYKDRGKAPVGYLKGMAIVYARSVCNQNLDLVKILANPNNGSKDVFVQYGLNPKPGIESIRKTFEILIGLGMRESSGRYCCGRDMSANFSSADSAEAGLFQTSWNARSVSKELPLLMFKFSNDLAQKCYLDIFKQGVKTCSSGDLKNWGSGDGEEYQKLSKTCPVFHAEFSAVVIRKLHNHYGPLIRKQAEVVCEPMLLSIEKYIEDHPDICLKI